MQILVKFLGTRINLQKRSGQNMYPKRNYASGFIIYQIRTHTFVTQNPDVYRDKLRKNSLNKL
ncbi:MAG: hypothetical protein Kow0098_22610 [Ignavibacteriaceae bacterium]